MLDRVRERLGLYSRTDLQTAISRAIDHTLKQYPPLAHELQERPHSATQGVQPLDQNFSAYLRATGMFPWVASCVDTLSHACASVPLKLYRDTADGDAEEIDSHPLIDLFENPNPVDGYYSLWYAAIQQLGYTGEVFFAGVGPVRSMPFVDPEEIWVVQSDRLAPTFEANTRRRGNSAPMLTGWAYTSGSGMAPQEHYAPEEIIHVKIPNPRDPIRGLSPLKKLEPTLNLLWSALSWNKAYFDNAASISLLITCAQVADTEINRFRRQVDERHVGVKKAMRPMIFAGQDVKTQDHSNSPKDAMFLELMHWCREEIFAVYHCKPVSQGIVEDANRSNTGGQLQDLYENAVIPWNRMMVDVINSSILMLPYEGMYWGHDYSGVSALQPNKLEEAQVDQIYINTRVKTVNEIRRDREFGEDVEWGDEPPEPMQFGLPNSGGFGNEGESEEDEGEKNSRIAAAQLRAKAKRTHGKGARDLRWKAFAVRTEAFERAWDRKVRSLFRGTLAAVLDDIDRRTNLGLTREQSLARKAKDEGVPPQWGQDPPEIPLSEEERWKAGLHPLSEKTLRAGAEDVLEEIGGEAFAFDVNRPGVQEYIERRLGKNIKTILQTQQGRVNALVLEAVENSWTIGELEKELRNAFGKDSRSWSERIARTETGGLYNRGALEGMEEAGVKTKEWLSSRDSFVRDVHEDADGQVVDIAADFVLSDGDRGPHPLAMTLPENVCNCRCSVVIGDK